MEKDIYYGIPAELVQDELKNAENEGEKTQDDSNAFRFVTAAVNEYLRTLPHDDTYAEKFIRIGIEREMIFLRSIQNLKVSIWGKTIDQLKTDVEAGMQGMKMYLMDEGEFERICRLKRLLDAEQNI